MCSVAVHMIAVVCESPEQCRVNRLAAGRSRILRIRRAPVRDLVHQNPTSLVYDGSWETRLTVNQLRPRLLSSILRCTTSLWIVSITSDYTGLLTREIWVRIPGGLPILYTCSLMESVGLQNRKMRVQLLSRMPIRE